jgi:hypothetical protein
MKYLDGREVCIGDKVIADNSNGTVVYLIETKQGSEKYPDGFWDYLKNGVMIETDFGLVHYAVVDTDVIFIERSSKR